METIGDKFTARVLSAKRVQSFRSIREQEVSNMIKLILISKGSPVKLSEILIALVYSITTRASIGKKNKDQKTLNAVTKEAAEAAGGFHLGDLFPSVKIISTITGQKCKLEKIHREFDKIMDGSIDDHKARREAIKTGEVEGGEVLLDVLLRIQENGELEFPLTTENIKAVIADVFGAGSETSSAAIEWAMSELLKDQRAVEKAQAEIRQVCNMKGNVDETDLHELKYLKLVIKETFRLHPSLPLLVPRECREQCEINGYEIPMKTKVIVNAWAIGRHPEYWIDAVSFIPERFVDSPIDYKGTHFDYIPFGFGRRICPGISFALANVELSLAHLLFHFDWKLVGGIKNEDLDMNEAFGATTRRKRDLCLIPIVYHPLPAEEVQQKQIVGV